MTSRYMTVLTTLLLSVGAFGKGHPTNLSATAEGLSLGSETPVEFAKAGDSFFVIGRTVFGSVGNRISQIDATRVSTPEGDISIRDNQNDVYGFLGDPDFLYYDELICSSAKLTYTYYKKRRLGIGYFNGKVGKLEVMEPEAWLAKYRARVGLPRRPLSK